MPWQKVTAFLAPQHLVELIRTECNCYNPTALDCYNTRNKTTRTQKSEINRFCVPIHFKNDRFTL